MLAKLKRCDWCEGDPLYIEYHDKLWGKPIYDSDQLFKMLILEGAQAGLSWITILKRWDGYEKAFRGFDAKKIAKFGEPEILSLMQDPGIIRNRKKIESTIQNAKAYLKMEESGEDLSQFLWGFVGVKPKANRCLSLSDIPAKTPESELMSKELKKRGFNFVGPTICYAFMQAVGMVDDHLEGCEFGV
jgi:DNA-3-methyladenine glycosylase I